MSRVAQLCTREKVIFDALAGLSVVCVKFIVQVSNLSVDQWFVLRWVISN